MLKDCTDSDLETIANRIAWGRFTNAGQTCVAVDYVLVHESLKAKLLENLRSSVGKLFKGLTKDDPNYTHLIHHRAFQNLTSKIDKSKGKILLGNDRDSKTNFLSPTIIYDVFFDDSIMEDELFGPILPIITYKDLSDAILLVKKYHDTPLAQYIFTSNLTRSANKDMDLILKSIRSGGVMVNDVLLHVALANAPFGGIGESGHGSYHGEYSMRSFSHERTTMEIALWKETALAARYPPFNKPKEDLIKSSMTGYGGQIWFGRNGNVKLNGPNFFWTFYSGIVGVAALGYYFYAAL